MWDQHDEHPTRWCPDCGRWIETPCEHEEDEQPPRLGADDQTAGYGTGFEQ